ncbi:MAG: hypothetical protein R3F44_00330 [Candidatus Competibacteraceae bacterium]
MDEALKLHQEMLTVFQALGDQRSQAVTLGDIARIRLTRARWTGAEAASRPADGVRGTGRCRWKTHTLWSIAQIEMQKEDYPNAFPHLQSLTPSCSSWVGWTASSLWVWTWGSFSAPVAQRARRGTEVLSRSRDGFRKLGQEAQEARQVQALLDSLSSPDR